MEVVGRLIEGKERRSRLAAAARLVLVSRNQMGLGLHLEGEA